MEIAHTIILGLTLILVVSLAVLMIKGSKVVKEIKEAFDEEWKKVFKEK